MNKGACKNFQNGNFLRPGRVDKPGCPLPKPVFGPANILVLNL